MKEKVLAIILIISIMLTGISPIIVYAEEEIIKEEESLYTSNKEEENETKAVLEENEINEKEEIIEDEQVVEDKQVVEDEKIVEEKQESESTVPHIEYTTHVQSHGWLAKARDGSSSGTTGEAKRMEAIRINLSSKISGSVEYITYIQKIGWEDSFKKDGETSGTEGEAKRLEAIEIRLTGEIAEKYDVYYRVHAQNYGWLNWAKNGETSGTIGLAKRLEAIEIKLVEKAQGENTSNTYYEASNNLQYTTHVQNYGWLKSVSEGISGTTGESKRIEAFRVLFNFAKYSGHLRYKSYIENQGWEKKWKSNYEVSGTEGKSKRIEQIKIELTGDITNYYDIYYRVHVQFFGWLGWAKNGESAGTEELDLRIEALEIKLVPKGTGEETGKSLESKDAKLSYNAHVQSIGNQDYVNEGKMIGTTGKSLRMEALTIKLDTKISGDILYKSYVDKDGWEENYRKSGELSGTIGEGKGIQLLRIKLSKDLEKKYDVFYRVHSDIYGWFDWAKNDEITGADCFDIQAVEIRLYLKIDTRSSSLPTKRKHIETGFYQENGYTYYKDKYGNQARDWIHIMDKKYFFNSLGVMIGKDVKKVMDVSAWQGDIDWDKVYREGDLDGVILRISASAIKEDKKLARNIEAVKRLNIPYGIYIYSYAENKEEAIEYANFTINTIEKYNMNDIRIGIFLDLEANSITDYLNTSQYEQIATGFFDTLASKGYGNLTKIYTYKSLAEEKLNSPYLFERISWIAQYNHFNRYVNNNVVGWQYSSEEIVPGIVGTADMSVWFKDF